jgi:hypothetical protein
MENTQAQIISPVKDPLLCGHSKEWVRTGIKRFITFCLLGSFTLSTYPKPFKIIDFSFFLLFAVGTLVTLGWWFTYERDEKTFAFQQAKKNQKKREKKGFETMAKYDKKTTEEQVLNHIPWQNINEETGLSSFYHPIKNAKEYHGNYGFTALALVPPEIDRKAMNEGFKKALRALPKGAYQKVTMMTGIDPKFILNDIDQLLNTPGLSSTRRAELLSMKKKFTQHQKSVDRTTLIYIGLPYTAFEETAQREMDRAINRYLKVLHKKKVQTIIIKEHQDMIDIYQGMLTGKKLYGVA